jgi:hypothetical protein
MTQKAFSKKVMLQTPAGLGLVAGSNVCRERSGYHHPGGPGPRATSCFAFFSREALL